MDIYIPYTQIPQFSSIFCDYIAEAATLKPFYRYSFDQQGLEKSISDFSKHDTIDRSVLSTVLEKQYQNSNIELGAAVQNNINALQNKNSLAIVTAHQPNLLTGPLYFIYKIVSSIKLSQQLQAQFPTYNFVPIYYMGSEDHDFAEINHIHLFGKTLTWQQNDLGGAVGRIVTDSLGVLLAELETILGNAPNAENLMQTIKQCYLGHKTLAEATRAWVHHLFGKYGLLIINPDDVVLKRTFFKKIALQEINDYVYSQQNADYWIQQTNRALQQASYQPQAFSRPVNLFYLTNNNKRERIEPIKIQMNQVGFKVNNSDKTWTPDALLHQIDNYTEQFSPNVLLRPLYQQAMLPAVAWVGGGGELAYWLQLKKTFEIFGVHYPVLVPRNSALWIDDNSLKKINKLGIAPSDLLENSDKIIAQYISQHSSQQLDLSPQKQVITDVFAQIMQNALQIDATLRESVQAEVTKINKSIEILEAKLLRAEKRNFEATTSQIKAIKDKLFPHNKLQERYDNMLPYYLKYGDDYIPSLLRKLDPMQQQFSLILS